MPSVRLSWPPNPESNIAGYRLESAPAVTGPWAQVVIVPQDFTVTPYDADRGLFIVTDPAGTMATFYRLIAFDDQGHESPPSVAHVPNQVQVDHNTGGADNLAYRNDSGVGIQGATVRVYADGSRVPIGTTTTDADGRWIAPIYVAAGQSIAVEFYKQFVAGPDTVTVTV